MSDEEKRQARAALLLDLDDQKTSVAHMLERDTRDREVFAAFHRSYDGGDRLSIEGDNLRIGDKIYSLSALDVRAALDRRMELQDAQSRLGALQARAKQLGINLI